jgi:hypothetical protein
VKLKLAVAVLLGVQALAGCGSSRPSEQGVNRGRETGWRNSQGWRELEEETPGEEEGEGINPTPEKESGEPSYEFEPEDIERAEVAPQSVREYCEGAVSEAQEIGCLSHVEPSEVP